LSERRWRAGGTLGGGGGDGVGGGIAEMFEDAAGAGVEEREDDER
jgi:hypothetical protein